jgi:hypothetical protein
MIHAQLGTSITLTVTEVKVSRCVDCYKFKTMVLNERSIANSRFRANPYFNELVDRKEELQVWFCADNLLNNQAYIVEYVAMNIINWTCEKREL